MALSIVRSASLPAFVHRLTAADSRRQKLARQLAALEDSRGVVRIDWRATERQARRLLQGWRGLLTRQVAHGRQCSASVPSSLSNDTPEMVPHESPARLYASSPSMDSRTSSSAGAAVEQLARPLRLSERDELGVLFRRRQTAGTPAGAGPADDSILTRKAAATPAFRALYRRWRDVGDPALWLASSSVLRDALERGEARIECVVLPHLYGHFTELAGVV